jgi:hypothetical protein
MLATCNSPVVRADVPEWEEIPTHPHHHTTNFLRAKVGPIPANSSFNHSLT